MFSRLPTALKSGRWWTPPAATRTWRRSPPRPRRTCRPPTLQRTCRPPTSERVQIMTIHQALPTDTRSGMESSGPSISALVSRNTLWISINSLFVRCKVENICEMLFMAMSATAPSFILLTDKKWILKIMRLERVILYAFRVGGDMPCRRWFFKCFWERLFLYFVYFSCVRKSWWGREYISLIINHELPFATVPV